MSFVFVFAAEKSCHQHSNCNGEAACAPCPVWRSSPTNATLCINILAKHSLIRCTEPIHIYGYYISHPSGIGGKKMENLGTWQGAAVCQVCNINCTTLSSFSCSCCCSCSCPSSFSCSCCRHGAGVAEFHCNCMWRILQSKHNAEKERKHTGH